jgi:hypothetical protein
LVRLYEYFTFDDGKAQKRGFELFFILIYSGFVRSRCQVLLPQELGGGIGRRARDGSTADRMDGA